MAFNYKDLLVAQNTFIKEKELINYLTETTTLFEGQLYTETFEDFLQMFINDLISKQCNVFRVFIKVSPDEIEFRSNLFIFIRLINFKNTLTKCSPSIYKRILDTFTSIIRKRFEELGLHIKEITTEDDPTISSIVFTL